MNVSSTWRMFGRLMARICSLFAIRIVFVRVRREGFVGPCELDARFRPERMAVIVHRLSAGWATRATSHRRPM